MKVRIGIDVGGTFTDAVAIDNDTYELIGSVKAPTTHSAKEGVAAGIVQVLHQVMEQYYIAPEDVNFIAHGTTQATNALLEGDVVKVGIVGIGSGVEGAKTKLDTKMGDIPLTSTKSLITANQFVEPSSKTFHGDVAVAIQTLAAEDCHYIVAAEAFSVDHSENEDAVVNACIAQNIAGTPTNAISKLYGLKVRTRTAVVNASIMPKMMEAAMLTAANLPNKLNLFQNSRIFDLALSPRDGLLV